LSAIAQATELQQLLQGRLEASPGKPPDRAMATRAERREVMGSPGAAA
jgi:hypothetical protein